MGKRFEDYADALKYLEEACASPSFEDYDTVIELLIHSTSDIVREAAYSCLLAHGSEQLAEKISALLVSSDAYVRNRATSLLAHYWPISKTVLERLLTHESKHVRKYALDALYMASDPDAIDLCSVLLSDEDVNNVIAAVEYLGSTYDQKYFPQVLEVLRRAIQTDEDMLTVACLEALANICDERCFDEIRKLILEPLELKEYLIPPYLRLFSRICRPQDVTVLMLISYYSFNVNYKEIIDATKELLAKYADALDPETRWLIGNWLLSLYEKYDIPSRNKYELLLLLAEVNQDEFLNLVAQLLQSDDPYLNLAALEVIDLRKLHDFRNAVENFYFRAKLKRTELVSEMNKGRINPKDSELIEFYDGLISLCENILASQHPKGRE